jgi:hypothetical protein
MSRPWERTGFKHPDLLEWVKGKRGLLLAALLTIARAWYIAGKPAANTPTIGGFEAWRHTGGGVSAYAGVRGFLGNLDTLYDLADEEAEEWEQFLQGIEQKFHDKPFTTAELVMAVDTDMSLLENLPDELAEARTQPGQGSRFNKRLGKAISSRVDRRYGPMNLRIVRADTRGRGPECPELACADRWVHKVGGRLIAWA